MSAIINRGVGGWVLAPGYPKLSGKSGDSTIIVRYTAAAEEVDGSLPVYGTMFEPEGYPAAFDRGLRLNEVAVEPLTGGGLWQITLTYRNADYEATEETSTETVELECRDQTYSVRTRPNYRMCWDHRLCAYGTQTVPAWWSSATDTSDTYNEPAYRWIGRDDTPPDGWIILREPTMVATEYLDGVAVVHYTKRARRRAALVRETGKDYKICPPPDDFGIGGDWLRGGSTIARNGKYWELKVDYTHAQSIDGRLYDDA